MRSMRSDSMVTSRELSIHCEPLLSGSAFTGLVVVGATVAGLVTISTTEILVLG